MTDDRLALVLLTCEQALAREGKARQAYLDTACGADAPLRAEVEALLARSDDSRDGFLTTPPWQHRAPALVTGQRLGPYEILGAIGAGGMGAVYKARDTRLGRIVAIKVIAADGPLNSVARERLGREARAIAAINHPNICAIYDVGREVPAGDAQAGPQEESRAPLDFLVIEYLEGETLANRVARGPVAVQEMVQIGMQIADALAAAHDQRILHGDLKPANIMLSQRPTGVVAKLLDFGLAELLPAASAGSGGAASEPARGVARRAALRGTLPYMAPEQLEGGSPDARTDIFAFGCVLYEMATGRRAFAGDSETDVATAIVHGEPPSPRSLQPLIPEALVRAITGCLAKRPDDRSQSALAVAHQLHEIAGMQPAAGHSGDAPRLRARWMWGLVAALAIFSGFAVWGARHVPTSLGPRTIVMPAPEGVTLGGAQGLEFSADGSAIIYFATNKGVPALYWQNIDETDPHVIPGTESPNQPFLPPFLSPDGRWLGFVRGEALLKVRIRAGGFVEGGAPVVLAKGIGWPRGITWGEDDTILYSPTPSAGLWRVSANGGPPRELTHPDRSKFELSHSWPQLLPGGRAAVFTIKHASGRQDRSAIAVVDLDSGRVTRLIEGGSYARYVSSGFLVYALNGSLLAVPFDLASLSVNGVPRAVVKDVSMESAGGLSARFSISSTGALAYESAPARPSLRNSLVWVDRDGQTKPAAPDRRAYTSSVALSPNGEKVAVRVEDAERGDSQLWAYDFREDRWQQLTTEGDNAVPVWSPTGDRIAFSSNRSGPFNLYVVPADGHAPPERLTESSRWQYGTGWSPDGKLLAYQEQEFDAGYNTWILPLEGDRKPRRWGPENVNAIGATFSADGQWIAYQSQESGRVEVYVRPFSQPRPAVRVSGGRGGIAPIWSRDGRSVLYIEGDKIWTARVERAPVLRVAERHMAFPLPFALPGSANATYPAGSAVVDYYGLAPGGRRVLMMQPDPQKTRQPRRVLVIPNWADELQTKVRQRR